MRSRALGLSAAAWLALSCRSPTPATEVPSERLAALAARVEAARELRFREPVAAASIRPEAVPALLAAELDIGSPPAQLRRESALAEALGLLPLGTDLRSVLLGWQSHAVAGFYSPSSRRLYVVAGPAGSQGDDESSVLVHELAHALQDQYTRLLDARNGIEDNDDLVFALGAFLEGDALWTELRDEAGAAGFPQATGRDFAERFAVEAPDAIGVPRLLRDSFLRQYPLGYALAADLVERGGVAALTSALTDPPLSSEELLHPERYLVRSKRKPLAWLPEASAGFAPERRCQTVATSSFGELGVGVWLEEQGLAEAEAESAANGWDGDRAWLLACERGAVVAWLIQLDEAREARQLAAAALRGGWAAAHADGEARVDQRGRRVLVSSRLDADGRRFLLERIEAEHYGHVDEILRARPEILERAAEQRNAR